MTVYSVKERKIVYCAYRSHMTVLQRKQRWFTVHTGPL